jgi:hypothetical protein
VTTPSPDQIRTVYDSPAQRLGRAIVERQIELNEIRQALDLAANTPHVQVITAIRALREENGEH